MTEQSVVARSGGAEGGSKLTFETSTDAPACHECGSIMVQERGLLQVPELRGDVGLQLEPSLGWGRLRPMRAPKGARSLLALLAQLRSERSYDRRLSSPHD